jgi:sigma-E factor negative regulatory protein RseB
MIRPFAVGLSIGLLAMPVGADQGATDALQLLQKVATAAQKVTYSGVFVYQNGNRSETSRITRVLDGDNELERLEVLDGSPREVIRRNDEVRCFLPDNKLLIVERRSAKQLFPTLLPGSLAGLAEYYQIRKGAGGRVAGIESQQLQIDPKDAFRYGHQLWIDPASGLLLKSSLIGDDGRAIETFAFSELRIAPTVDKEALKAQFAGKDGNWQVHQVRTSEVKSDDGQWIIKAALPGFRRISGVKRQLRPDAPEGTQLIYSDGLASLSAFIEPSVARDAQESGFFSMGAVNAYRRQIGDYRVVVMGDVPPAALRRFAEAIEPRRK